MIIFSIQAAILSSPHGQRALSPGRIVTITTAEHKNALAVILQAENASPQGYSTMQSQMVLSASERKFEVLVICDPKENKSGKKMSTVMIRLSARGAYSLLVTRGRVLTRDRALLGTAGSS